MIEDKLTHDERVRLECLAQAVQLTGITRPSPETVLETARRFEGWVNWRLNPPTQSMTYAVVSEEPEG